jgi:hypothetical protein
MERLLKTWKNWNITIWVMVTLRATSMGTSCWSIQ